MIFFRKVIKYGIRRAFVYVLLLVFQRVRVLIYRCIFSDNNAILRCVKLNQPAQFVGRGRIEFDGVGIGVWPSPGYLSGYAYFEARKSGASIGIGQGTFLNNGAVIIADRGRVSIGQRCLIGQGFYAVDSDFHGLDIDSRTNGNYECADVSIGNDVFIGNDVRVLKGVNIGNGAVIGSGSLVLNDVPEMTIYAGVPAKFIRNL